MAWERSTGKGLIGDVKAAEQAPANINYVATRLRARMGGLYTAEQFRRFAVMETSQLAAEIGEGAYAQEIADLSLKLKGVDLVERAVVLNLEKCFQEVRKWAQGNLAKAIELFLSSYDVDNLRAVLRTLISKSDKDLAKKALICAGGLKREKLEELLELESIEELRSKLGANPLSKVIASFAKEDNISVRVVEEALISVYYREIIPTVQSLWGEILAISNYFGLMIDCANLRTVVGRRLRGESTGSSRDWMFSGGFLLKGKILDQLDTQEAPNVSFFERDRAIRIFGDLGTVLSGLDSLDKLEPALRRAQLNFLRRFTKLYPASEAAVLEYFFRKRLEVDLLRLIARANVEGRKEAIDQYLLLWQ